MTAPAWALKGKFFLIHALRFIAGSSFVTGLVCSTGAGADKAPSPRSLLFLASAADVSHPLLWFRSELTDMLTLATYSNRPVAAFQCCPQIFI